MNLTPFPVYGLPKVNVSICNVSRIDRVFDLHKHKIFDGCIICCSFYMDVIMEPKTHCLSWSECYKLLDVDEILKFKTK